MLRFIEKASDSESLLCAGKLRVYSYVVETPIRVLGVPISQVSRLVELYDEYGDVVKRYSVLAPVLEIDIDVKRDTFRNFENVLERASTYIYEVKKKFSSYVFAIPFLSSEISRKIVYELSSEGRSYALSVFLSHYVGADYIDILSIPVIKAHVYEKDTKRVAQIVNASMYVKYIEYSVKFLEERIDRPFFIPFIKLPDTDIPPILKYLIDRRYTNILLDYEGSSYKRLSDTIRLLQIEYDRAGMLKNLILYGTRILREAVSKRRDDEVKFADILALIGLDILGSNYKKPRIVDEERPIVKTEGEEPIERFFNNDTYGYKHESYLKEEEPDLYDLLDSIRDEKSFRYTKKTLFNIINVNKHRIETYRYSELVSKAMDLREYLRSKKYIKHEDLKVIKRGASEHKLDDYL